MAFDTDNLAKAAFKKLFGKAHTGPPVGEGGTKDLPNESVASRTTVAASDVYGEAIPLTPPGASTSVIRVCITGVEGELDLTEDGSSNGNTYYVTVPVAHDLTSYTNPETGSNYVAGERVQNIIPASFGGSYRPIIKDNGTEVPPTDASDWFLDDKAGTLTSETDLSLSTTGTIACYVYVGDMVEDLLGGVSTHSLLDATVHTDTATQTVSRGSLIVGDSTPEWNEVTIGTDQQSLVSDGTDAAWGIPGVTSVVTVGKGGAVDFNTVQGAVDYVITQTPSTSNRFVINIYKGTYVEDVDMTGCPYTNLNGVSRNSNDVTIQTVNGTALTFDNSFTPAFIANIQLQCKTPTSTTGICVEGYGIHIFDNCLFDVGGSTAGAYARYAVFSAGVIQFNSCRFQSSITGTSAGANTYALVEMTGTAFAMNNTSSLVTCGDVDDNITFFKINSVSNRISVTACLFDYRHSNASHSGNFTMFDINQGSAQTMYISGCDLNMDGAGGSGTATMFDIDSTTNDGYVVVTGSNCEIRDFGTNYVSQHATGDEIEIVGCHVEAADEWTGAGIMNFASLLNDVYVLSPLNNVNEGNQAWGAAPINSNHQVSYTEVYTSNNKDGIYFYPIWTPSSSETGARASIAGYSILGASSNWGAGASLSGLNFGTWAQGTSGGSANLDLNAIKCFGAGSLGGGITTTAKEVCGIRTRPTDFMQAALNCDAIYGIKVDDCFNALTGTQTNHYSAWLAKPTEATNQYCLWLDGSGTGSGAWFGATTNRIYNDGTDLTVNAAADFTLNPTTDINLNAGNDIVAGADLFLRASNRKLTLGAGNNAEIYYDGTDLIVDPKAAGSGVVDIQGDLTVDDTIAIGTTASTTKYLNMEKTSTATSGSVYAIWNNHTVTPSSSSTGDFFGIGGFCSVQNTNFGVGSSCTGLNFQNFSTNITSGSANLDCIGISTVGIGAFQSIVTVKSAIGLQAQSLNDTFGSTMTCTDAYGIYVKRASNETITNAYGMYIQMDNGATNNYGLVISSGGNLCVGGTPTNTSCGLELISTTKAVMLPRMTTTQRNALTAVNGMIIYNSSTGTIQGYTSGSWSSL